MPPHVPPLPAPMVVPPTLLRTATTRVMPGQIAMSPQPLSRPPPMAAAYSPPLASMSPPSMTMSPHWIP